MEQNIMHSKDKLTIRRYFGRLYPVEFHHRNLTSFILRVCVILRTKSSTSRFRIHQIFTVLSTINHASVYFSVHSVSVRSFRNGQVGFYCEMTVHFDLSLSKLNIDRFSVFMHLARIVSFVANRLLVTLHLNIKLTITSSLIVYLSC